MTRNLRALGWALGFVFFSGVGSAAAQVPGRCEMPASQRANENGCCVSATATLLAPRLPT